MGLLAIICLWLTGCHGANHYYAENSIFGEKLPASMRLAERPKTHTVDLTRLAGGAGDSDTINAGDVLEVKIAAGLSEDDQATMGSLSPAPPASRVRSTVCVLGLSAKRMLAGNFSPKIELSA